MTCEVTNSNIHLLSIKNEDKHECCICFHEKDVTIEFDCHHHICLSCFKEYAIINLNRRQFQYDPTIGYSLGCPDGCTNTLLRELHIFHLMDKTNYERYKTFGAEEYVFYHHGVLCPTPACGSGLIVDGNRMKIVCSASVGCGKTFCRSCKSLWEDETMETCPCQIENLNNDNQAYSLWNYLFSNKNRTSSASIKKCPRCSINTEKDGGCNAITCTQCGMTWCWICEMEFRTDCIQSHWF